MNFLRFLDVNIQELLSGFKTENVINFVITSDPVIFFTNLHYLVPIIFIGFTLFFLKFKKTLIFIIGLLILWHAFVNYLPKDDLIQLNDVFTFGITCILVLATWIYFFFIRTD